MSALEVVLNSSHSKDRLVAWLAPQAMNAQINSRTLCCARKDSFHYLVIANAPYAPLVIRAALLCSHLSNAPTVIIRGRAQHTAVYVLSGSYAQVQIKIPYLAAKVSMLLKAALYA